MILFPFDTILAAILCILLASSGFMAEAIIKYYRTKNNKQQGDDYEKT